MSTIRQMLPQVAQPFTEAIVGAGLGALISKFVLKGDVSTGAIVGGAAGYGLSLTKGRGAFPFTATAGGVYTGDSVTQFPTYQQGYAQPYGGMQQPYGQQYGQQYAQQYGQPYGDLGQGAEVMEELVPQDAAPDYGWPRHRRDDWWRRGGGGGYGRGGGSGYGRGGWGHGWHR